MSVLRLSLAMLSGGGEWGAAAGEPRAAARASGVAHVAALAAAAAAAPSCFHLGLELTPRVG